ncbi:hypothetical protein QYZ88_010260 [Lachnospiraceae bacterium C1.1]|nr:hypothetical protein [Lachnospiraceae bacterium C1.1]
MASLKGEAYGSKVENSIKEMQKHLSEKVASGRTINQDAGFAAEIWHTDTFNLMAELDGSEFRLLDA